MDVKMIRLLNLGLTMGESMENEWVVNYTVEHKNDSENVMELVGFFQMCLESYISRNKGVLLESTTFTTENENGTFETDVTITYKKVIKSISRSHKSLYQYMERMVWKENKYLVEDLEKAEAEKVEAEKVEEEKVEFKPELTAISTNNSYSAKVIAEKVAITDRVLDYGCGTGRNIEFISKNSVCSAIDGTDIEPQLEKEKVKHNKLRELGHVIEVSKFIKNSHYDYVLNSHVLNVIADDEIKEIVVQDIYDKLKKGGEAIIEVRTKSDVEGAKTKEKHGDGWKIKKGSSFTYQEAITKEKMTEILTKVGFKIKEHVFNSSRHMVVACK